MMTLGLVYFQWISSGNASGLEVGIRGVGMGTVAILPSEIGPTNLQFAG